MNQQLGSLKHQLDERGVELKSLFELSQILNASLEVKKVLNNCLLTPMGRMLISRGMALSANDDGGFVIQVVKGLPSDLTGTVLTFEHHFSEPLFVRDASDSECPNRALFDRLGLEVIVPMISNAGMVGAICFGSKITKQEFTRREIEFLSSLSNIAASAVENALMFQQLANVNRQLDKKVQELNTLFSVGKDLNSTLDKDKMLHILVYTVMGEMAATKMLVYLRENGRLEKAVNRGVDQERLAQFEQSDAGMAALAESITSARCITEQKDDALQGWTDLGLKAAVPMMLQHDMAGLLLLGPKMSGDDYQQEDLEFLTTLCNRVMISIENARLFEETLEKQRLEEEIAIAREIQQRLLPNTFPHVPGIEIFGLNIPSFQVGGDYFDCFQLNEERIVFAIGDVSGKGVGASLLMSNLHAGLHTVVQSNADIQTIVSRLNDLIYANTSFDKFITFFYAEINPLTRRIKYVNAGHNPPYLAHADKTLETLETGGLLLGILPGIHYQVGEVALRPGDRLITFTDGVTEAKAISGEMYEEDRLEALIRQGVEDNIDIRLFADQLLADLDGFSQGEPQADDITMLALHVLE